MTIYSSLLKLKKEIRLLSVLLIIGTSSHSQVVPKEDYIYSKSVSGSVLATENGAGLKGSAYLYFTDSCVILHFDGLGNKTIFFKIFKKYWNQEDKHIVITCYDSTKTAKYTDKKELGKLIPDLSITIEYNSIYTLEEGHTKSTSHKYVNVVCWFNNKGFMIYFGSNAQSQPNNIPIIRRKFSKLIID